MDNAIHVLDYNFDWFLDQRYLHPRTAQGSMSREEVLHFCGTLGVDGIELREEYWFDCRGEQIARVAADAGIGIKTYLFSEDLLVGPRDQQHRLDKVYSLLEKAAATGTPHAWIVPGEVKPGIPLHEQRSRLIEGLRKSADKAEELGLILFCENIDYPPIRPLMGRGSECRSICEEVGSAAFRLIYDACAPVFAEEDTLDAFRTMAPHVRKVHLKNTRQVRPGEQPKRYLDSVGGQRYTGVLLDQGVLDIPRILKELHTYRIRGPLTIEYQGELDPREAMRHNIAFLRKVMKEIAGQERVL